MSLKVNDTLHLTTGCVCVCAHKYLAIISNLFTHFKHYLIACHIYTKICGLYLHRISMFGPSMSMADAKIKWKRLNKWMRTPFVLKKFLFGSSGILLCAFISFHFNLVCCCMMIVFWPKAQWYKQHHSWPRYNVCSTQMLEYYLYKCSVYFFYGRHEIA